MTTSIDPHERSRRAFLLSSGRLLTGAWIAAHWPAIAAAHHTQDPESGTDPQRFAFFDAAGAADIEALSAQIVPSGATSGAKEARAAYFIDRALSTFLADWSDGIRPGLAQFQRQFREVQPATASFAAAAHAQQLEFLSTVDRTAFFETIRTLTLLGMFSSPKYGGNFRGSGWAMMGFADQHGFSPPFGEYDREYRGFVPYSTARS